MDWPIHILVIFASVCIYRFLLRRRPGPDGTELPSWVIVEGVLVSALLIQGGIWAKVARLLRRKGTPLYGISSRHLVLVSPAAATAALRKPLHVVNNDAARWTLSVRAFGCRQSMREPMQIISDQLFVVVSKNMLQEKLIQDTYGLLQTLVPRLVSHSPWTANANLQSGPDETVVDLYELVRDFTTHVSVQMLAGADFLACYPGFAGDIAALDLGLTMLALGIPTWFPVANIQNAVAARKRLLSQVQNFVERLEASETDFALRERLRDTNKLFWDRAALYQQQNIPMGDRAASDLMLFWAMNGNTSPLVFWVLVYLYADQSLLAQVRLEVDACAKTNADAKIDADALVSTCPYLKACYLEAFRLVHAPTSLRYVRAGFDLVEEGMPVRIPAETFLTIPHTVQQFDPTVYPNPTNFDSRRFLRGGGKTGYGKFKPWGDGRAMCKGSVFAEREVLSVVGMIVHYWDIEAIGTWTIPGLVPGMGVAKPAHKLRVKMRIRDRGT